MKKIWKRISVLIIAAVALITLTGCSITTLVFKTIEHNLTPTETDYSELSYSYTESDFAEAQEDMANAREVVNDGTASYYSFAIALNTVWNIDYVKYRGALSKCYALHYLDLSNKTYSADTVTLLAYNTEFAKFQYEINYAIAKSSFRSSYYQGMSDARIEEFLKDMLDYDDTYETLSQQMTELENQADALDEDSSTYFTDAENIYYQYVQLGAQVASHYGYDSYLDWLYKFGYGRDYTPSDMTNYRSYIKQYIVPLMKTLKEASDSLTEQSDKDNYDTWYAYERYNYNEYGYAQTLESYMSYMGSAMYKEYKALFNSENSPLYWGTDNGLKGAFTMYLMDDGKALCYFGEGYQSISTIVHELGHATAFTYETKYSISMDLSESQSQGNEMIYLNWLLKNNTPNLNNTVLNKIKNYELYYACKKILQCMLVNDFEEYVYAHPETPASSYNDVYKNVVSYYMDYDELKTLFGYEPSNYWHYVTTTSAGYYVSYSVSEMVALELYALSYNNLDDGKTMWYNITNVDYTDIDATFLGTLSNAGMNSPLEEDSFKAIYQTISQEYSINE